MKTIIIFLALAFSLGALGATVDTVTINSNSMHRPLRCVVIKPETYHDAGTSFPVVYLLHGYSDRYDTWIRTVPGIMAYADMLQMILVCPDGGYNSWYFDSPVDSASRFETHICLEVVPYIDRHYRTKAMACYRAITGLSMGGHGALYLAIRHPGLFGNAGSMSGGVDMRPFPGSWDIARRIGDIQSHSKNWESMSVINMVEQMQKEPPNLMIECGTEDFFYHVNLQLHQKLVALKIPHDYVERPGSHTWDYWSNAVGYQLFFFSRHFNKKQTAGK